MSTRSAGSGTSLRPWAGTLYVSCSGIAHLLELDDLHPNVADLGRTLAVELEDVEAGEERRHHVRAALAAERRGAGQPGDRPAGGVERRDLQRRPDRVPTVVGDPEDLVDLVVA